VCEKKEERVLAPAAAPLPPGLAPLNGVDGGQVTKIDRSSQLAAEIPSLGKNNGPANHQIN
jgi:hypothetical protein